MSLYDYERSIQISARDEPFYALLFTLMLRADDINADKLRRMWPEEWEELYQRYHAPGGLLKGETPYGKGPPTENDTT